MPSRLPPRFSVVVPCADQGEALESTLESVFAQTTRDLEVVVVNAGSTDADTNRRLLSERYPAMRLIQSENRGLAAARNLGLEHALGATLCMLEPGDALSPAFLEKAAAVLDADASVAFVLCWLASKDGGAAWTPARCDLAALLAESMVPGPTVVRAAAVRDSGGYDGRFELAGYQDCDVLISLLEGGSRGRVVEEVLARGPRRVGRSEAGAEGERHLRLMGELVSKHETSYREHLLDVLVQQETWSCELLKTTYALDREIDGRLEPRLRARQQEVARLERKIEAIERERREEVRRAELVREATEAGRRADDLRTALAASEGELEGARRRAEEASAALARKDAELTILLGSRSWLLTAPLRVVHEALWRWRHAGGPPSRGGSGES